jgi:hypothetical protein
VNFNGKPGNAYRDSGAIGGGETARLQPATERHERCCSHSERQETGMRGYRAEPTAIGAA